MKKVIFKVSAAFILLSFAMLEESTWSTDAAHSRLGFTINHMGISDINGEFKKFDVKVNQHGVDFTDAIIEMSAEVNSINTGIDMRDDHLKTPDFFSAEKFPVITFKSTSVKKSKANSYTVTGNLTMHGFTKSVSFVATHNGTAKNQAGNDLAGLKMTGSIKRSDFKIGDASPMLSDEVKLIADIEVAKN